MNIFFTCEERKTRIIRKYIVIILIISIFNNIFYPISVANEVNGGDIIIEIPKIIYINGEEVNESRTEENWTYDKETNTLTLNNYNSSESYNEGEYNIYAEGDLNLILNGINTITSESNNSILVEGELNISGTGTLVLNNYKETGIKARKDIRVKEEIKIVTENTNKVLNTIGKDIIIESGNIEASNSDIVSSNGQIIIKKGNITVNNIKSTQKLKIENGIIKSNRIYSSKEIEVTGGEIYSKAIELDLYMPLTIKGGKIEVSGSDIGINTSGNILIEDGDINVEGTNIGISGGQLNLQMTGGKLVAKGGRVGISKNIEISGGELYARGETEYGIDEVSGDHVIKGGYVEATGGKIGIRSDWSGEIITGGTVKATGSEYGIYAGNISGGTIEISNCEAEIYGGKQALYSTEGVTIGEGLYYKTGTTKEKAKISTDYYFENYLCLSQSEFEHENIIEKIYINGEEVDESKTEENWTYDKETNTLTLNNYNSSESYNEGEYNIYAEGDLNLILNGINTITSESNNSILVEGELNISGTGTLVLNNYKETGIKARKDIRVKEEIKIVTENTNKVLNTIGKDIIIESGNIEASNSDIVSSNGQIIIKKGNITVNNIKSTQKLKIENGIIKSNRIYSSKEIEVTGGEIYSKAIELDLYMPLTIKGGKIEVSGSDIGINTSGNILIEDGDINVEGTNIGISGGQLNLQMTGGKLVAKGGRVGISKNIEISGGELYARGETEYGIDEVSGDHVIKGGYVEATGGKIGIRSDWSGEIITGGTVKATGSEYGIYAGNISGGTIEISNCEAEIYGGKQALYSTEGVTIGEGLYYKTGTTKEKAKISTGYYFEKYLYLNIITKYTSDLDEKTTISIEGAIDKNAKFEIDVVNNIEEIYKEMIDENFDLSKYNLKAYNIELVEGEYEGELTLIFELGIENNNKNVQIWHKTHSGNIEIFNEIVIEGKVTIKVQELSPFAIVYENNYFIGDINYDGKVNIKDWNRLYNHINETEKLNGDQLLCADVNGDGKVNIKDWNRMYDHITEVNPLW